ncbi:Cadherin domain protein [Rubripirellula obstinata]|uniref:Cadherin domain protein n=2 Tax=Rubripirellula obstinata TaxID=406547 RepID=A0A5B1CAK5_9BACT|nr:Cadherin domain protein [Rubripirellula obstinata]
MIATDEFRTRASEAFDASPSSGRRKLALQLNELEPRLLFSATPFDVAAMAGAEETGIGDAGQVTAEFTATESETDSIETLANQSNADQTATEIVFIDSAVPDLQQLLDDLNQPGRNLEAFVLDADRDGIDQITEVLDSRSDLSSIHIVSHAENGSVKLGNLWLGESNLDAYAGQLAAWQSSLTTDADILLYGCDLAQTQSGQTFLDSISALTGADVAASDDDTGHATFDANWELEYATGLIETDAVFSDQLQDHWIGKLATITVTTNLDVVDGDTSSVGILQNNRGADGMISLREAILAANAGSGGDTILLGSGTYTLAITGDDNNGLVGDLDITESVSIIGVDARSTIIDGGGIDRVFHLRQNTTVVSLSNLTIQGGSAEDNAGGIFVDNKSTLNLTDVSLLNNDGDNGSNAGDGGAIYVKGTLNANRVTIAGNTAVSGAGIYFDDAEGGKLTNVTLSGNTSTSQGGGIYNDDSIITVNNSTITENHASNGGGIRNATGTVSLSNTIVAGNTAGSLNVDVLGRFSSDGSNLIGSISGTLGLNNDISGVSAGLGSLADNGGQTDSHALLAGSPAIHAGAINGSASTDQRGAVRNGPVDIGSFELQIGYQESLWLSTSDDVSNSGTTGLQNWTSGEAITLGDPNLNLGSATSDGTISSLFNLDDFVDGTADIDGLHYVSRNVTVGGSNAVDLQIGDVLFSTQADEEISIGGLQFDRTDIVLFRPTDLGDYSSGTFSILMEEIDDAGLNQLMAFSLVEQDTIVGDVTLQAGDFLYASGRAFTNNDVYWYQTTDAGAGTTSGTRTKLLEGEDMGLGVFSSFITGIELIETDITVGGKSLTSGMLLLQATGNNNSVGDAVSISTTDKDIFVLEVLETIPGGGDTNANAFILLRGSDIGLNSNDERIDAIALGPNAYLNSAPTSISPSSITVNENTDATSGYSLATLTTTDVDASETFTYSIVGGADQLKFSIGGTSGDELILTDGILDFENNTDYEVIVRVTDSASNHHDQTISVSVIDLDDDDVPVGLSDHYVIGEDTTLNSIDAWYDADWGFRRTITFENSNRTTDLNGFPVLIKLDASRIDYAQTQNNGQDLRFVDGDGTVLAHEIESWDASGTSYVWVNVPTIDQGSNSDFVWMYYGNSSASDGQDRHAVWSSGNQAVYHLDNSTFDGTSNNNGGTNAGATFVEGRFGDALSFDGTDDIVTIPSSSSIDDVFSNGGTVSAWFNASGWGENNFGRIVEKPSGITPSPNGWSLLLDGNRQSLLFNHGFSGNHAQWRVQSNSVTLGQWHQVTVVYDASSSGNAPTIYLDGVAQSLNQTNTPTGTALSDAGLDINIGNHTALNRAFDGVIDEVRLSSNALSNEQVTALYESATDNLVTFGYQQTAAGVIGNDTDRDGDTLTATLVGGDPANAAAFNFNSDGTFTYTPDANFNGTDTFTYRISDGTNDSDLIGVTITVLAVNDAPTFGSATLAAIGEDTANPAGETVANLFGGNFADVDDSSSMLGIIVVANDANDTNEGVWQYTSDNTQWFDIGSVDDAGNGLAVTAGSKIRFVPVTDFNGTPTSLVVRALDNTFTGNFSSTAGTENRQVVNTSSATPTSAFSNATTTLTTTVTANVAPVIGGTVSNQAINDDQTTAPLSTLTLTDNENDSVTVVITLSGGDANGQFTTSSLTSTGFTKTNAGEYSLALGTTGAAQAAIRGLVFTPTPNQVAVGSSVTTTFQVTVNDGRTTTDSGSTVVATSVNDAPTDITLSNASIDENVAGAVIGTIGLTDPDIGETFTLAVDDNRFEVVGNNLKLKTGEQLDRESASSITLTITATDQNGTGLNYNESFTITVGNVNEAPTDITLTNANVAENTDGGIVGTVSVTDPDAADSHTWTVDDTRFELDGTTLKLRDGQSLDHEIEPSVSISITATDQAGMGLGYSETFTIVTSNQNENPTDITLDNTTVQGGEFGAMVGQVAAIDPDNGDTHTWQISDSRFTVIDGSLKLKSNQVINASFEPTINLVITATDAGGLTYNQSLTIDAIPPAIPLQIAPVGDSGNTDPPPAEPSNTDDPADESAAENSSETEAAESDSSERSNEEETGSSGDEAATATSKRRLGIAPGTINNRITAANVASSSIVVNDVQSRDESDSKASGNTSTANSFSNFRSAFGTSSSIASNITIDRVSSGLIRYGLGTTSLATSQANLAMMAKPGEMWNQFDQRLQGLESQIKGDLIMVGAAGAATSSFMVGVAAWGLRTGFLASGLMAQLPAWRAVDPLLIMQGSGDGDDESLEDLIKRRSDELDDLEVPEIQVDDSIKKTIS